MEIDISLTRYSQLVLPIPNKVSFGNHRIGEEMKPLATALRCRIRVIVNFLILLNFSKLTNTSHKFFGF
jgi:hypothetical protein